MTITVRSAAGNVLKTLDLQYPGTWFEQVPAAQQLGLALNGDESITYSVTSGSAIVYGVRTDDVTQDPSIQFAEPR